jgi:hypothetical protein
MQPERGLKRSASMNGCVRGFEIPARRQARGQAKGDAFAANTTNDATGAHSAPLTDPECDGLRGSPALAAVSRLRANLTAEPDKSTA